MFKRKTETQQLIREAKKINKRSENLIKNAQGPDSSDGKRALREFEKKGPDKKNVQEKIIKVLQNKPLSKKQTNALQEFEKTHPKDSNGDPISPEEAALAQFEEHIS